jgi:hypothetical protein
MRLSPLLLALPLLASVPALTGCTSLQSVSVTQVPTDRSRPLRAEVTNTALLGIHFDNEFLDALMPQLMQQCPRGRITGLLTKQESSLYVIVATRRVIATGYCVYDPAPQAQTASNAPLSPAPPPVVVASSPVEAR